MSFFRRVALAVVLTFTASTLAMAVSTVSPRVAFAESTTTAVVDSIPPVTVVSGLHAGDRVDVEASLTTTEPDENGESEPLIIRTSSNSFFVIDSSHAVDNVYTFTVTTEGDSLTAFIPGADGDESATIQVVVNPDAAQIVQSSDKAAARSARDLSALRMTGSAAAGSVVCGVATGGMCDLLNGVSADLGLDSLWFNRVQQDRPDPNFMQLHPYAWPRFPTVPAGNGVTATEAMAGTALNQLSVNVAALSLAAITSINRASGARAAGDTFWEAQQTTRAKIYLGALAKVVAALPPVLTALAQAMNAAGHNVSVTNSDVQQFEYSVATNGLPPSLVSYLKGLGADDPSIERIRQILVVQPVGSAAGPYPDTLIDPALLNSLRAFANALAADAGA